MTASSKEKHTPGPWTASETYPRGDWCIHSKGIPQQLAYVAASSVMEWPLEANARLIAAAPELLEALRSAETAVEELCIGQNPANQCWVVLAEVRAAIAKATGAAS